ncbi:MAG: carbamoyltransferase HypF [Nannocystaceae bacterium]
MTGRVGRRGALRGVVQGIGFRPCVARLARALGLAGEVANIRGAVVIVVEGAPADVDAFVARLAEEAPAAARVEEARWAEIAARGREGFVIAASAEDDAEELAAAAGRLAIGPDLRVCAACLAEVERPGDRREGYAFTSCTACGPRLTIAAGGPWAREASAMARFVCCAACTREYLDAGDRRWHAEAIACPQCGPTLRLEDLEGARLAGGGAPSIAAAAALLRRGEILGLMGIGGVQLLVDAGDEAAVRRLRARKRRPAKPLALMVRDLDEAAALVDLGGADGALARATLAGAAGPIVVLSKRTGGAGIADAVAPGLDRLGVMLPTTPAHALLLRAFGGAAVATSGNVHERPIATTIAGARAALRGVADALLVHERPILRRCDDAVVHLVGGAVRTLRLGRGLAPARLRVPGEGPTILALGGDLQAAPLLAAGGEAIAWPHVGDLREPATRAALIEAQADLCAMVGAAPEVLACDAHPDYASSTWARAHAASIGAAVEVAYHHHAHVASVLAEHGRERALGVAWDGVGFGVDRTAWGGEFLAVDGASARRVASLSPFALPGGDAAARDGLRPLAGLLVGAGVRPPAELASDELDRLTQVAARPRLSPITSSVGRLFDAIACLVGGRRRSRYQGEAAIELEQRAAAFGPAAAYDFTLRRGVLDWRPALRAAVAERGSPGLVAARLHATLVAMIVAVAERQRAEVVALAGGCFANALLLAGATAALGARGIEVLSPRRLPPGDGGLALGQAWIVRQRRRAGEGV